MKNRKLIALNFSLLKPNINRKASIFDKYGRDGI